MSVKTEVVQRTEGIAIHHCDLCDKRLGPAPVHDHGGYFVSCSQGPRNDTRPAWYGVLCRDCLDEIRERSGFDA